MLRGICAPWLLGLVLVGCNPVTDTTDVPDPTDTPEPDPTGDSGTTEPFVPAGPELDVENVNNYTFEQSWTFPSTEVRAGFNITVDWGEVDVDAYGVDRASTSYDRVFLLNVGVDRDTFLERWNEDALNGDSSDLLGIWWADVSDLSFVRLGDLEDEGGDSFDFANFLQEAGSVTWLLGVADYDGSRYDLRIGTFVTPLAAGTASRIEIDDPETVVTWSAALDGDPLLTSEIHDVRDYVADWRGADTTVYGTDYDRFLVDELFIGHWADAPTPEALAASVLDLESSATRWWTADIERDTRILLQLPFDQNRERFEGFEAGGTWLMGARCSTCFGPAPWWLTVVDVEAAPAAP